MFELSVKVEFEAAHRIVDYPGKCNRLHGHNWVVEVNVTGTKLNELGMLVDFKDLKQEVNEVMEHLDHRYLNELPEFAEGHNPTAEHIAEYIYNALADRAVFQQECQLKNVKVWESAKSAVIYSKGE